MQVVGYDTGSPAVETGGNDATEASEGAEPGGSGVESGAGREPKADPVGERGAETETGARVNAETETGMGAEAETETGARVNAETETGMGAEAETDCETDTAVGGNGHAGGFYVAVDGKIEFIDVSPGTELAFGLGERHCAGTVYDGTHVACEASDAPYCNVHTDIWVCARCTGTCLKDEMDCHESHAMYLAAFAPDVFKVGVTREWRLETRLREQGADRAAHLRTFPDGRIAREVEADLAGGSDLVDSVRVSSKIDGLHRRVDEDAWAGLLARFDPKKTFAFEYGLGLTDRPVAETIAAGTVRGWQGRILVVDRNGSSYAVDARDLVGYELVAEPSDRALQSSLGAFG